jgi:RES domain-containing protein
VNLAGCGSLTTARLSGTWYRAIQPQFWHLSLQTSHTKTVSSRFNPSAAANPGFEILYLAENQLVALFEVQALLGSPLPPALVVPNPHHAWVVINVRVQLQQVVDLTDVAQQSLIDTTAQELTGDWRGNQFRGPTSSVPAPTGPAPTQELGAALFALADVEGFLAISTKVPTHQSLIVFPERLKPGSHLEFSHQTLGLHRVSG